MAARQGIEMLFIAQTPATGGTAPQSQLTVACQRKAGRDWRLYVQASHFDGNVRVSFDGSVPETYNERWRDSPEGLAKDFDAESVQRLLPRLVSAKGATVYGPAMISGNHTSVTYDLQGFAEIAKRFVARCPVPEARSISAASAVPVPSAATDILAVLASTEIPATFRGTWTSDPNACAKAKEIGYPDDGAVISDTRVDRYENYCALAEVTSLSSDTFAGTFHCQAEGEKFDRTITLKQVGRGLSIDGFGDYRRCN